MIDKLKLLDLIATFVLRLKLLNSRICGFILFCFFAAAANAASVQQVRHSDSPERSRLVLELDGPVQHTLTKLSGPERVAVRLVDAKNLAGQLRLTNDSRLKTAVLQERSGSVDLVLQTHGRADIQTRFIPAGAGSRYRLVVDIYNQDSNKQMEVSLRRTEASAAIRPVVQPATSTAAVMREPKIAQPKPLRNNRRVVVAIDAGHGGKDPGAIGPNGTQEKTVVLEIARRFYNILRKEADIQPVFVRDNDHYISLRGRVKKAKAAGADVFISIHADAVDRPGPSGASIYRLSAKGASSEAARLLAWRENKAGEDSLGLVDKTNPLASVLLDMVQSETIDSSDDLGLHMLNQLQRVTKLHKRSVQSAGFAVLKSPAIPSVLIETGFISNPAEEKRLADPQHQERVAMGIRNGLFSYLNANPPDGTIYAQR